MRVSEVSGNISAWIINEPKHKWIDQKGARISVRESGVSEWNIGEVIQK
jgi:hypothetical protein